MAQKADRTKSPNPAIAESGFSFRAIFDDDSVSLRRTSPDLPSKGGSDRVVPAYFGASHPIMCAGFGPSAKKQNVKNASFVRSASFSSYLYEPAAAHYQLPEGRKARVVLSRLTPAVLLESDGTCFTFSPDPETPKSALKYIAYVSDSKTIIQSSANLKNLENPVLDDPWLLAWFGDATPHRGYPDPIDLDDPHDGAGFARTAHPCPPLDLPILFRFEHNPSAITLDSNGLRLDFEGPAGKLAVMPAFGGRIFEPAQTEAWARGVPDDVISTCKNWDSVLRDYPLSVTETFTYDPQDDELTVRQAFTWISFEDSYSAKHKFIPPLLALAWGTGAPLWFYEDGMPCKPNNLHFMDTPGCAMDIPDNDMLEYRIGHLNDFLDAPRLTPAISEAARPLQAKLERHVTEMIDAGHLAPLFYVYGGIGGPRPGYYYWGSFPELAEALGNAWPWLSPALRERARAYLLSEFKINPPFEVNLKKYREGANRAPYDFPWQDVGRNAQAIDNRERAIREWRSFGDLYGLAAFGELTGDFSQLAQYKERAAAMLDELLGQQDWALMGPVKPHGDRLTDGFTGASWYERNGQATVNSRLAGAIGLVRLARKLGWQKEEEQGRYLFAKLAMARIGMARYTAELHRMGLVRGEAKDDWRTLVHIDPAAAIVLRGNPKPTVFEDQELPPFIDLTPEVGALLGRHAREKCRIYLDHLDRSMPLWYISEAPKQGASEQRLCPLQHKSGNVTAQFYILNKRGPEFLRYVDATRFKGDFYYINNLAAALASY